MQHGVPIEISYEAIWAHENLLAADIEEFARSLALTQSPERAV